MKDYGLEDVCVALDAIEAQLKRIIELYKYDMKRATGRLANIAEIEQI